MQRRCCNRLRFIAQEDRIPLIKENVEGGRQYHRDWVERIFAPQLGERSGEERERAFAACSC